MSRGETRIRQAVSEDARGLAEAHVRSWQAAYKGLMPDGFLASLSVERRERQWREFLDDSSQMPVWLCEIDGECAGYVQNWPGRDRDAVTGVTAEVGGIYLVESAWGLGLGKALLDRALEYFRDQGFREVVIWVHRENRRAVDFYRRQGFVFEGSGITLVTGSGIRIPAIRYHRRI